MAGKYVKCPCCGLRVNASDYEPEMIETNRPFEIECERCKACYEVTPVRIDAFYEVGKITYLPKATHD